LVAALDFLTFIVPVILLVGKKFGLISFAGLSNPAKNKRKRKKLV